MAVHAHPDDEASTTGGILARYSAEGVRTVLVTCTNGELGDGPGGVKPEDPAHDEATVVPMRLHELERSCEVLGVNHLELLGFHDSGMMGWPQNELPGAFWNTPVAEASAPLVALMERYRPQVVVTYDAYGFYGHPDHIQAHRITMAAAEQTGIPAKLYFPGIPKSRLASFADTLRDHGVEPPGNLDEDPNFGTDDELIAAVIDCSAYTKQKFDSLACHASQADNIFFLELGREVFDVIFGTESFERALDSTGAPTPEDDLFAGLR
jgi:LmbE family N-acetylglucosaminyl deacetylase